MLQMTDRETGLTMTMDVQSKPQNPRMGLNNMFRIVTWPRRLGDPHPWRDSQHFLSSIDEDMHLVFRLQRIDTHQNKGFTILYREDRPAAGYAFAPLDLIRLEFGISNPTPEMLQRAEHTCLAELGAHEEYLDGRVYSFRVFNEAGVLLEQQGHLYGQDYAEHVARTTFKAHRMGIIADSH